MKGIRIDTSLHEGVLVATLSGEIDLLNCDELGQELLASALAGGGAFVIDLSPIQYADSNGIRMLFVLAREFDRSRIKWAVALADASPLWRLFKVTTFDEVAAILPSVEDAAATLA
jgi:anti-anti-sigma factor